LVLIVLHSASLRGLKKIKEYSILQDVATSVLSMILLCLSIIFIRDEHAPLLAYVISLIIVCAYSLKLWFKHADIKSYAHGSRVKFKNMLNVSLPMLLSSSSFLVLEWTDTIMLGMYRTAEEVGVYSVAMKVAILTFIMLYAINSIAAPKFAEIYGKGDKKDFELIVKQSTKLIFWSSLPIILSIFLFPSFILGIFGQQFTIGVHALLILTFGQFIRAISGSVGYILQMTGRQRIFQNILISGAVINIGLNALLIPRYGINGAAIASTISTIFWNLTSVLFIKFHLNITTIYLPGLGKVGAK
jgi:O-antigen/teichoic acid export membrane protein